MAEGEVGAVAPVETPVAAPEATPLPDTTADQVETKPEQPERTFTQKELDEIVQKRLSRESKRVRSEEARIARAEAEANHLREQLAAKSKPDQPQGEDAEPREEDFAGKPYRDFVRAQARWEIRQELKADRERQSQQGRETQQTQRVQQQVQYVQERLMAKGLEKYPDFEDKVLADDVPISPAMVAVAAKLDNGYDVLYHLANNEAEMTRISRLSDIEQSWELRDFSTKLKASPKPTQTPPPIVPNAAKATVEKRLQDANVDEFFAIRKKQIAAKRGR